MNVRKLPGPTAGHVDDWRALAAERRAVRLRASRDTTRHDMARRDLARRDTARRDLARREAARREAARREAARHEAARHAVARPTKPGATRSRPIAARPGTRRRAVARRAPVHTVGTGSLATAIDFALAAVGDPYQLRASGPDAYDCSGLVMAAFGRIGIELPHSSAEIIGYGRPVSRAQLRPGDLVFPHPGHVAIYLGGGRIVEAANERAGVRVAPLWGFWTARRLL